MVIRVTRRPYGIGLCLGFGDTPCVHFLHSRLEGERETARFSESGGRGIVLRFAAFYGPDAPSTVERATPARRRMLLQVGPGTNYISSIYVPDAGRAVVAALGLPAGTYNVCDDGPVTFADYLRILIECIRPPRPFRLPSVFGKWMFGDVWSYFARSQRVCKARLKEVSDWKPTVKSVFEGWPLIAAELANSESPRHVALRRSAGGSRNAANQYCFPRGGMTVTPKRSLHPNIGPGPESHSDYQSDRRDDHENRSPSEK